MKFALLLARQRSGTGALGSVLSKHPELVYLGEVFHPNNLGQDHNFFSYLIERVGKDPDWALPDKRLEMFEGFLTDLYERYDGRTLIVDVKYRSLHHCNGSWQSTDEKPGLLRWAQSCNAPLIHLTRGNYLQSFVSGRLAEENQTWHAQSDEQVPIKSTVVDIGQLSNYIVGVDREISHLSGWLQRYQNLFAVDYADLFDASGSICVSVTEALEALLGVKAFLDSAPVFVKQAPVDVQDAIENLDLVSQALSGTPHAWMVQ